MTIQVGTATASTSNAMIVSIASGKGGTGKTTIATNLAISIASDIAVQFFDCDVEEPNAHLFLKPKITDVKPVTVPVPRVDVSKCTRCGKCSEVCEFNALAVVKTGVLVFPELCHGCGSCAKFCPQKAITEVEREIGSIRSGFAGPIEFKEGELTPREVLSPVVITKMKREMDHDKLVILDAPPGTSCPVIESVKESDFCVLVTEPTPFGLSDLKAAADMAASLSIPTAAVINRADIGNDAVKKYCQQRGIPILMELPWDREIAESYSWGEPIALHSPRWKEQFREIYVKLSLLRGEAEAAKGG